MTLFRISSTTSHRDVTNLMSHVKFYQCSFFSFLNKSVISSSLPWGNCQSAIHHLTHLTYHLDTIHHIAATCSNWYDRDAPCAQAAAKLRLDSLLSSPDVNSKPSSSQNNHYQQQQQLRVTEDGRSLRVQTDLPHLVSLGGGRLSTAVTLLPLPDGRFLWLLFTDPHTDSQTDTCRQWSFMEFLRNKSASNKPNDQIWTRD